MIVFNFTGLRRVDWRPAVKHESDRDGLWYTSVRWLGVEVVCYSVAMGAEFIRRFNKGLHEKAPEVRQVPDPA